MKTKTLILSINIPFDYKWMARQPYGDITLFKRKPKIVTEIEGGGEVEYWGVQRDNINILEGDLSDFLPSNQTADWKKSLVRI